MLGFMRYLVFVHTVGATYLGNVYQSANLIPNVLFEVAAAGGFLSAVFVPTFVGQIQSAGRERAASAASALTNRLLVLSVPLVVGGVLLSRPIMLLLTSAVADPAVRARQVEVGRFFLLFFLPQVPMYFTGMVARALLNAHGRFLSAALAPAWSSLFAIVAYIGFRALGPGIEVDTVRPAQLYVLAAGTTAGILAWMLAQVLPLAASGYRWRPLLLRGDAEIRLAMRGAVHGATYFAVTEIGLLVTLVLANRVRGGVVAWQVAFAFYELPNALVGVPIAVYVAPALARRALETRLAHFAELLSSGWRAAAILSAPAGVGLAVLAMPLARVFFGAVRGSQAAPSLVGAVLSTIALGLPAFVLSQLLVRGFYAIQHTRAPIVANGLAVATQATLALVVILAAAPSATGTLAMLGAAHAAGQWAGLALAVVLLSTRVQPWLPKLAFGPLAGAMVRAALMGAMVLLVTQWTSRFPAVVTVAMGLAVGVGLYAILSRREGLVGAVHALRVHD